MARDSNKYLSAFKENFNVLGLATAAAVSAATLNPLPLLAGVVAEAAYLLFVPDSRWYERRLSRRHDAEIERRRRELKDKTLPQLRPEMRDRYLRLEQIRRELDRLHQGDENWYREVLRKLDYLLDRFLTFAAREVQFRTYLRSIREDVRGEKKRASRRRESQWEVRQEPARGIESQLIEFFFPGLMSVRIEDAEDFERRQKKRRAEKDWPPPPQEHTLPRHLIDPWVKETVGEIQARYEEERKSLEESLGHEQDIDTKAVIQKRLEVLQRRHEFIEKLGKILINLNHQMELLEDTFGLISDEIRARPPEQILADIDDVVWQTNTMTQVLEQIAPYEQPMVGGME